MAYTVNKHPFKEIIDTQRYDEAWSEERPYISGSFLGFHTEYRKQLISFKTKEVPTGSCLFCGKSKEDFAHI